MSVDFENVNEDDFEISDEDSEEGIYEENQQSIEFDVSEVNQDVNENYDKQQTRNSEQSDFSHNSKTDQNDDDQQPIKRYDLGNYLTDDDTHKEKSKNKTQQRNQKATVEK